LRNEDEFAVMLTEGRLLLFTETAANDKEGNILQTLGRAGIKYNGNVQ
jgi:hypothetical protein